MLVARVDNLDLAATEAGQVAQIICHLLGLRSGTTLRSQLVVESFSGYMHGRFHISLPESECSAATDSYGFPASLAK